ncbi:hypothetical protein [Streptomyces sp. SID5643]|uniref:hypothetical protein n=1 Tax=Streptomyces sp. SID5643 TaxID=2690307 RepID=UPI001371BFE2|nr:hypothetical protein [Streptomyces sp. SID5643]MZF90109.1 hypothetical protein [Streptomyces sp. SID5643]
MSANEQADVVVVGLGPGGAYVAVPVDRLRRVFPTCPTLQRTVGAAPGALR